MNGANAYPPSVRLQFRREFAEEVASAARLQWTNPNSIAVLNSRSLSPAYRENLALLADMGGVLLLAPTGAIFVLAHETTPGPLANRPYPLTPNLIASVLRHVAFCRWPELRKLLPAYSDAERCVECCGTGGGEDYGVSCPRCGGHGQTLGAVQNPAARSVKCPLCAHWTEEQDTSFSNAKVRDGVLAIAADRWVANCICRGTRRLSFEHFPRGLLPP